MSEKIKAPTFPESVQDGTVASWHKKPGEAVARDELIVEIETDKVVLEVVAPADGVLGEVLKQEGDTVLSNEVLATIESADQAKSATSKDKGSKDSDSDNKSSVKSGKQLEIKTPTFPESVQDGTISAWHKTTGDSVSRDELIVEIETDKVVLEVVAPANGVMADIIKQEGDTVQSGEIIAYVTEGADGKSKSTSSDSSSKSQEAVRDDSIASPSARKSLRYSYPLCLPEVRHLLPVLRE